MFQKKLFHSVAIALIILAVSPDLAFADTAAPTSAEKSAPAASTSATNLAPAASTSATNLAPAASTSAKNSAPAAPTSAKNTAPAQTSSAKAQAPRVATPPADPKQSEKALQDMAEPLKKLYRGAKEIQAECNQTYNADALDNVIMDPWMEGNPGLMYVQPPPFPGALKSIPPRRKWIDYDMNQITQLLKILNTEVTELSSVTSLSSDIRASYEVMQDTLQQELAQYEKLNRLTHQTAVNAKEQPLYDTVGITRTAQALKDETSGLNELRKRLLRLVRDSK